jgi:hypothetical protein
MTMYTIDELARNPRTKGELFQDLRDGNVTFDYPLPQYWLDHFAAWCQVHAPAVTYGWITSTTVWAYGHDDMCGGPVSVCHEVQEALLLYYNS